ncbi:MAG: BspA family leucine-rich repeat surface protein, partial [Lachnospiraceae bacterium]|nr:BspA family leucine-rich repeat surface protein [Lachnospiraceae bacterium]
VNFTAGTFELQGNFTDNYTPSSFNSSGTNTVILSGKTVNGSDFIQSIKISDTKTKFNKLILKKPDTAYKFSRSIKKIAKNVERDVDTSGIPSNVSDITAASTESSVKLIYSEATDDHGVTGYRICRNGSVCGATTALTFTDTGLKPNTTYTYTVYAIDAENNISESSPSVTVTTKADNSRPEPVKSMSVSKRTGSSVTLTWKAAVDNVGIKEYEVYRKDDSGDYVLIAEHVKKTTYKDAGITAGVSYKYYLVAIDTSGNRSENGVVINASASSPRIISVYPEDGDKFGENKIEFNVTYENWGNSQNNTVTIEYEDRNDEWQPVTSYPLSQYADQYNANRLYSKYTWYFENADFNDSVRFKITLTDEDNNTAEKIVSYIIDRTAPAVPEEFEATDNGGIVKLLWAPSASDDCAGYIIYRSTTPGQGYSKLDLVDGRRNLVYLDKTVKKNVKYYYAIEAYDEFNNISEKAESGEVVVEEDRQLPVVKSIGPTETVIGNGTVTISVKAEDNKAVQSVALSIKGVEESHWSTLCDYVPCTDGIALYNLNTAAYTDGDYYILAKAIDVDGNVSLEAKKRFTFDNTGISKTTLTGTPVSSTVIEIVWGQELLESDFAYYSVERLVRIDDGVPVYAQIDKVYYNYNYCISNLLPGEENTYIVVGYDICGNRGVESDPVTVATFVDTEGPSITWINKSGTPYSDIIPLSVTAQDDLALGYAVFKYLTDEGTYKEIERIEAPSNTKEHTFICNWNVSGFEPGNVYVLYEVYDSTGHKNLLTADGQDVTAYFIIDRTAPGKVTGLKLDKSSGSVDISWDEPKADAEVDKVASFVVMREEVSDNGSGSIEYYRNIKSLYYSDENVSIGNEYIYRVAAVDMAGNQGEFTDGLRVCVDVDNIAPEIQWINSNYRTVLPINPEIHILATDNRNLASLYVEYASADSDNKIWNLMYQGAISGTIKDEKIIWNTDGLTEGKYTVRAYATDEKGNESAYKTAEFTLDLTAPEKPVLNVKNGNMYIDIEIEGNIPEDFKKYEIYRRESGSTVGKRIYIGTEKKYRDTDVKTLDVYYYQVAIYDIHDNKVLSDEKEGVASNIDDTAPEAILTSEILTGVVGEDVTLSGCNSRDNVGITEYKWFIDDTYIGKGIEIKHKFTEAKDYKLKLEVYDRAGNVGIAEGTVKISEKETTGTFVITVKAEDGASLAGATVFIEEANGSSNNVMLNSNASCSFTKEPGDYRVAAYVDGYLPDEISVSINAQEKKEYEIKLKKDKLLKVKASVRKLEPQELARKGVDISNPANYNTVEVKFDVIINNQPYQGTALASPDSPAIVSVGGSEDSSNGKLMITMTRNSEPVIIYYEARPAVSWLKDFYEVYVSITNQASSVYSVDDLKATINLPQYISFAALTNRVQTETIELGNLQGQDSCSASWIVKSSVSKKYTFNVDINGIVMPFNTPYETKAVAEGYIDATSGSNLHLFIVINKAKAYYDTEFVDYVLINEGKKEYKNVSIVLSDESIEYNVGGKEADVEIDKSKVTIGTLKPWEPLSLRSSVTDTIGKAYKESNLNYHIDYLRGKNLGIQISVVDELPDLYHKEGEVDEPYGKLKWEVKYGILTVEGTGDYDDPEKSPSSVKAPWHDGETEKHIGKAEIDVEKMTLTTAMFKDCSKLKSFTFKKSTNTIKNMSSMFENYTSLTSIKMEQLKSYAVTDISKMFLNCSALYDFDGSNFVTSKVTNITGMFKYCSDLRKLDLSSWDFSKVDKHDSFLYGCKNLTRIESPKKTPSENISIKDCLKGATWMMKNEGKFEEVTSIVKNKTKSYTYTRTGKNNSEYDIEFNYASTMTPFSLSKDVKYGYKIDFKKFFTSSYVYQQELMQASIRTAMAAFDRNDYDVKHRDKNILDLMDALDFENVVSNYPETGYDTIGYAIGSRDIFSDTGDEATLILVAIRGQGYELEWGGDFEVGTGTEHQGFNIAAGKVITGEFNEIGFKGYIDKYGSEFKDKVKIWVVGYSRGAATANLVCEKIIDGKAGINGIDPKDVFGFCFECPRTTTSSNPHAEKYNGIKSVVNPIDFVPMVPMNNGANWNFERYGITYTTGALDDPNFDNLKNNMIAQYRKILVAQGMSETKAEKEVDKRLETYSGNFDTQEEFCAYVFKKLADNTVDRSTYVNNLQSKLMPFITEFMLYTMECGPNSTNILEKIFRIMDDYGIAKASGKEMLSEIGYFVNTGFVEMARHMMDISKGHFSEQCLAWVDSIGSDDEFNLYSTPILSTGYLLYYDDNDGEGAPPPIIGKNYNGTIKISSIEPTRDGYIFAGWMLDPSDILSKLTSIDYADYYPEAELDLKDYGKTLHAKWAKADKYY